MKKVSKPLLIGAIVLVGIIIYIAFNFKEVKQTFVNGVNDGKAEKAKEEKK